MKAFLGAIALSLAAPAFAQTAPATDLRTNQAKPQPAQCQQAVQHSAEDMHKLCRNVMKHHAKTSRRAKTAAEQLTAEVNGNGHQGHNH